MTYRHSDREGERCKHITFSLLFGIAGFMLAMSTMNKMIRYCSLWVISLFLNSFLKGHNSRFFMAQSSGGLICLLAWASGSVSHPPEKRAVALALINCVGQFGNILGSYVSSCTFKNFFNCFFDFSDISGQYHGDLHIIYLILSP
jgi:hypothetical protein